MALAALLNWFKEKTGRDTGGRPHPTVNTELKANAEKALAMKRAGGPQTSTPEYRTSHEGEIKGTQVDTTDASVGAEATHAANLKRSHVARTGDGR